MKRITIPLAISLLLLLAYGVVQFLSPNLLSESVAKYVVSVLLLVLSVGLVRSIDFVLFDVIFQKRKGREAPALLRVLLSTVLYLVFIGLIYKVVLHGVGSYALGRNATARRLLELEGLGIVLVGLGGGLLFATGAARDFAASGATLAMAGAGLFTVSFTSDLYSVLAPPGGLGRDPSRRPRGGQDQGGRHHGAGADPPDRQDDRAQRLPA